MLMSCLDKTYLINEFSVRNVNRRKIFYKENFKKVITD